MKKILSVACALALAFTLTLPVSASFYDSGNETIPGYAIAYTMMADGGFMYGEVEGSHTNGVNISPLSAEVRLVGQLSNGESKEEYKSTISAANATFLNESAYLLDGIYTFTSGIGTFTFCGYSWNLSY